MNRLITIDGPAASGKSSLSRHLARRLGWKWVSTGVFYRGIACLSLTQKLSSEKGIATLVRQEPWEVILKEEGTCFLHRGVDITSRIYTNEVDEGASLLARYPLVRQALLEFQKNCFRQNPSGLVAEGRDCGTVVFPEAGLKIYLNAPAALRARRRTSQRGVQSVESTMNLQNKRDHQDINRLKSPLKKPDGAFEINTASCPFEEMVLKAYQKSQECFALL